MTSTITVLFILSLDDAADESPPKAVAPRRHVPTPAPLRCRGQRCRFVRSLLCSST